jgi:hypothetical protein
MADVERYHNYHAEASILEGQLKLPLVQEIKTQAYAKLHEKGGYFAQHEQDYKLEGVISFRKAYTQVAGNVARKEGHGWSTLATSVVEGLNVLEVVTADRVVAQVSLAYPTIGYVPHITFLGTRYDNLKIAGHPVECELDLDIFGPKPDGDKGYLDKGNSVLLDKIERQHGNVQKHPSLIKELIERYTGFSREAENPEAVECSLVHQAGGKFPGNCFGHVIHIPNFGSVVLGSLRIEHSDYKGGVPKKTMVLLKMLELHMGCVSDGQTFVATSKTNGTTMP